MLALNIFTKLAKSLGDEKTRLVKSGAQIIKVIEEECEKDKGLSNLKGKIKETKSIIN